MAKDDMIEFEGVVKDVLPDGLYRVGLDNGHDIIAYTAGRMKKFRIRILAGDRVTVEMTPYELTKGRINFRHTEERAGGPGPGARHTPPRKRRCRPPRSVERRALTECLRPCRARRTQKHKKKT